MPQGSSPRQEGLRLREASGLAERRSLGEAPVSLRLMAEAEWAQAALQEKAGEAPAQRQPPEEEEAWAQR